jgi:hypothetical protein
VFYKFFDESSAAEVTNCIHKKRKRQIVPLSYGNKGVIYILIYFSVATLDDPSPDIYEELVVNFSVASTNPY